MPVPRCSPPFSSRGRAALIPGEGADVTLVGIGGAMARAEQAAAHAGERGIGVDVIDPRSVIETPATARLAKIHLREGAQVMPGQLLAEIDED